MSKFLTLFKVNLLSLFGINKKLYGGKKGKLIGTVLLGVLIMGLSFLYSMAFIEGMKFQQAMTGKEINSVVHTFIVVAALITFIFSFYSVANLIYGAQDYDMLAAMPVKKHQIVFSKLLATLVGDIILTLLIVIPAIFAEQLYLKNLNFLIVVSYLLCAFVCPFLPIAVATLVGALFTIITAKIRFKNLFKTILYLLVIASVVPLYFTDDFLFVMQIMDKIYFIKPILDRAMDNVWYLLAFVGINVGAFVLVVLFVSLSYHRVNSLIKSGATKTKFKMRKIKGSSPLRALVKHDLKRLFTCPIYLVNAIGGVFVAIVIIVPFFIVASKTGEEVISILGPFVSLFVPAFFVLFTCLAPTTACSISVEGNTFWQLKTLPVKASQILNSKLIINLIFYIPLNIIISVAIGILFKMQFIIVLLIAFCGITVALFASITGLYLNLKLPLMDWTNVQKPVKQGGSVGLMVLVTMLLMILLGAGGYAVGFVDQGFFSFLYSLTANQYVLLVTVLLLVVTTVLYVLMMKNSQKLIDKI